MKKYNRTMPETASAGFLGPAVLECRFCGAECPPELEEMPCQNCKADTYFRFVPPGTPRNYREILNSLKLKDRDIAAAFGYKDLGAFTSSTAARRVKAGVEFVFYAALYSDNFEVKKGWVMVKKDGTIWFETFAKTNTMCWALAIETWALDGETKKDHPEWRPMQGFVTVVLL